MRLVGILDKYHGTCYEGEKLGAEAYKTQVR